MFKWVVVAYAPSGLELVLVRGSLVKCQHVLYSSRVAEALKCLGMTEWELKAI